MIAVQSKIGFRPAEPQFAAANRSVRYFPFRTFGAELILIRFSGNRHS